MSGTLFGLALAASAFVLQNIFVNSFRFCDSIQPIAKQSSQQISLVSVVAMWQQRSVGETSVDPLWTSVKFGSIRQIPDTLPSCHKNDYRMLVLVHLARHVEVIRSQTWSPIRQSVRHDGRAVAWGFWTLVEILHEAWISRVNFFFWGQSREASHDRQAAVMNWCFCGSQLPCVIKQTCIIEEEMSRRQIFVCKLVWAMRDSTLRQSGPRFSFVLPFCRSFLHHLQWICLRESSIFPYISNIRTKVSCGNQLRELPNSTNLQKSQISCWPFLFFTHIPHTRIQRSSFCFILLCRRSVDHRASDFQRWSWMKLHSWCSGWAQCNLSSVTLQAHVTSSCFSRVSRKKFLSSFSGY